MRSAVRVPRLSTLGVLALINFATAGMGLPLTGEGGKFSVSNIAPVLFVIVGTLLFFVREKRISRNVVWFLLLFNLSVAASFAIYLVEFGWVPNFIVLFFQNVELVFCLLLVWYARTHLEEFRRAARAGIYMSAVVAVYYAWSDITGGAVYSSLGMDDKSHSAVLLCCAAFVLIRFFGSPLDRTVGAALYVLAYFTISRLPVFFAPAIALAMVRRSNYGVALAVAGTCVLVYLLIVAADAVAEIFIVYDRLSSIEALTGSESTTAHLLLLEAAVRLKFSDATAFLFGIGPSNFSKALTSFPISTAELEAIDPQLIAYAREGRAPLHSMPFAILLDYNITLFLLFVFATLKAFRFVARRGILMDLAFAFGMLVASLFYSVHNKPYFFLYVTTIGVLLAWQGAQPLRQATRTKVSSAATSAARNTAIDTQSTG